MEKIIIMKKQVADSHNPHLPLELTINKTSYLLTNWFFSENHPFRKRLEKKVFVEDIENRRIKFDVGGYAEQIKDSKSGNMKVIFVVCHLWLWVCTNDHRKESSGYDQMQTMYFQGKLEEYLYEQGVNMPSHNPDETKHLLNYLSRYISCIWEYFDVVEAAGIFP